MRGLSDLQNQMLAPFILQVQLVREYLIDFPCPVL
jgi:hypothetical protein